MAATINVPTSGQLQIRGAVVACTISGGSIVPLPGPPANLPFSDPQASFNWLALLPQENIKANGINGTSPLTPYDVTSATIGAVLTSINQTFWNLWWWNATEGFGWVGSAYDFSGHLFSNATVTSIINGLVAQMTASLTAASSNTFSDCVELFAGQNSGSPTVAAAEVFTLTIPSVPVAGTATLNFGKSSIAITWNLASASSSYSNGTFTIGTLGQTTAQICTTIAGLFNANPWAAFQVTPQISAVATATTVVVTDSEGLDFPYSFSASTTGITYSQGTAGVINADIATGIGPTGPNGTSYLAVFIVGGSAVQNYCLQWDTMAKTVTAIWNGYVYYGYGGMYPADGSSAKSFATYAAMSTYCTANSITGLPAQQPGKP